jgi:hypothetical protein
LLYDRLQTNKQKAFEESEAEKTRSKNLGRALTHMKLIRRQKEWQKAWRVRGESSTKV